jgi:hypothetical protein
MSFSKDISAFATKAEKRVNEEYRKNVLAIWADTVRGTPRITGTLRANWQIGINRQNSSKLGASSGASGGSSVAALKWKDTAIIYNNMEYAEVVENGLDGTRRVPRRMLARAILAAQARRSRR